MLNPALADDLPAPIRHWQLLDPGRPALLADGRSSATYGDLVRLVEETVDALTASGILRGARLALVLPNAPETAVCILAVASQATCIPFNPSYAPEELGRLIKSAGTNAAIVLASDEQAKSVVRAAGVGMVFELEPTADGIAGAFRLRATGRLQPPSKVERDDTPALVLHTSGSTGGPKRVPLTVRNLLASADNVARSLELGPHDTGLSMMPMFHIGALVDLLLAPLSAGGAVCFASEISGAAFFEALERFEPTWFQAVPTLLRDLLASHASPEDCERMRRLAFIRSVSQPLPPVLQNEFEARFGVPLLPMFGMTETAGVITSTPRGRRRPGSVGIPFGPNVRIADQLGNEMPAGEIGEVLVAGDSVMVGYEGGAEAHSTFVGSWLRTGDLGYRDPEGYLFLTGRSKEQINRGGEKIAPTEIDLAASDHPAILEAAAFAMPHPSLGEEVGLAVVARPGLDLEIGAITAHLRQRLAPHKVPRHVYLLDRLPRVPSGKLDRRALPGLVAEVSAPAARSLPQTQIERELARLWSQVLGVEEVALEDDFFDLGGDSLRATTLAMELEERFGATFVPAELFDSPTLADMARVLDRADRQANAHSALDPDIHRSLQRITAGWRGKRRQGSLIVGRNTLGSKRPFFWIPQSLHGFEAVAANLDPDRPVYGMPTLSLTGAKTDENTRKLAAYYAREITAIDFGGPYLLGGFCQGAVVAFEVAEALKAMGKQVLLLCLQDRFIPKPYSGAVALFSGKRGYHCSHYVNYVPERAWPRYYSGPMWFRPAETDHEGVHNSPHAELFARQLEEMFALVETASLPQDPHFTPAPADASAPVRSRVRASVPYLMRQGEEKRLRVVVTNRSAVPWQPTEKSGIVLAARWTVWRSSECIRDSYAPLSEPLQPGASAEFELTIRVPMRGLPIYLELTVIEDGLSQIEERDTPAFRRLVLPIAPLGLNAAGT